MIFIDSCFVLTFSFGRFIWPASKNIWIYKSYYLLRKIFNALSVHVIFHTTRDSTETSYTPMRF